MIKKENLIRKKNYQRYENFSLEVTILENPALQVHETEIKLEDILSLDIPQLMILFFLSVQITETVRYTLLQDLNKFVFSEAKLSASSFYNTLEKLERLGLLEVKKNKSGRVKSIRGKPNIKNVLNIISQYTTILSFDVDLLFTEYIPVLEKFVNISHVNNLLFIDIEEFFDFGITTLLKKFTQELFLLADDESFERYRNRGLKQVHQSQAINAKIREPDKIFDAVIIMDYQQKNNFYGMNEKTVLAEAIRVTKSQGIIVVVGMEELPVTNNFFLVSVVRRMRKNPLFTVIKNDIFKEVITSASPVVPEFSNSNGMLLAKINIP